MKIIALEEHVVTALYVSKMAGSQRRTTSLDDRSAKLGHDIRAELSDIGEGRIKHMDAAGIDVQVLSLTMPGTQAFDTADAPAVARDVNDRIHDAVKAHPTRFAGFAALPTADPAAAAKELERTTHLVNNYDWWDKVIGFQIVPGPEPYFVGSAWLPVGLHVEKSGKMVTSGP